MSTSTTTRPTAAAVAETIVSVLSSRYPGSTLLRQYEGRITGASASIASANNPGEEFARQAREANLGYVITSADIAAVSEALNAGQGSTDDQTSLDYLTAAQVQALRDAAERNHAPSFRVEAILADSGLIEPEPEPEPEVEEEVEVSEKFGAKVRAVLKTLGLLSNEG